MGATGAWHRDLYEKYGPIEEGAYEDLVLGFRAAIEGKFCVLNEPLVTYRLGFGTTSNTPTYETTEIFARTQLQKFKVMKAVLTQRRRDALTFGYLPKSTLLKAINRELLRSDIGIKYYAGNSGELWVAFLTCSILTLNRILSKTKKKLRNKKMSVSV